MKKPLLILAFVSAAMVHAEMSGPPTKMLCAILADDIAAHRNAVCSPYSLGCSMEMAALAARGGTFDEIRAAFDLGNTSEAIAAAAARRRGELAAAVRASSGELLVFNSFWSGPEDPLRPDFAILLRDGCDAEACRLSSRAGMSVADVNHWVFRKTKGYVSSAVDDLPPETRLLLVNVIYFKMKWACEFNRYATTPWNFHPETGNTQRVPFMNLVADVPVLDNGIYRAVRLPYRGGKFEMEIVLPNTGRTVADVLAAWETGAADPMHEAFSSPLSAEIYLPRFHIRDVRTLSQPLQERGVTTAFHYGADFTGAFERHSSQLFLSDVRQSAFIDVDEEGTTAAATTIHIGIGCAAEDVPMRWYFLVDRPFLFLLRFAGNGDILFAGTVFDAAAAGKGVGR